MNNVHDKLFKEVFQDKDNAVDFIQGIISKELLNHLDLSTLKLDNTTYVTDQLEQYYSDIVYTCLHAGNKLEIAILFEHKSYNVKYPHIQLLQYIINIWTLSIKQNKPLKIVLPILLYHGKEKWDYRSVYDYFANLSGHFKVFIPAFDYILVDLSQYKDQQLIYEMFKQKILITTLLLMKNIYNKEKLKKYLKEYISVCKMLFESKQNERYLKTIVTYLLYGSGLQVDCIIETMKSVSEKGGQLAMSTATKLIKMGELKGMEKGIEKGIEKGKIEIVKNMLQIGMEIEKIKILTELSEEKILEIMNK
jgi:predicted transposase/invertase (TIGR01784 family)